MTQKSLRLHFQPFPIEDLYCAPPLGPAEPGQITLFGAFRKITPLWHIGINLFFIYNLFINVQQGTTVANMLLRARIG